MSSLVILGDTSGSITLQAPAAAGSTVLTLPTQTGTVGLSGPAFAGYLTNVNQSVSNSTTVKVNLNAEWFDTNNCFDTSNGRFTPNVAGYYMITAGLNLSASAIQTGFAWIYKNGTSWAQNVWYYPSSPGLDQITLSVSSLVYCNGTTDYIELYGYITSGGTRVFQGSSTQSQSWMHGHFVRAA